MKKEKNNWESEEIENNKNTPPQKKEKNWLSKEGELAVDVYDTPNHIVIQAPIAGISRDDVEITTEKDMVIIKGKRERPEKEAINSFYTKECFFGNFQREIILPEETDPSRIEADMKDGVLTVRVPKIEREKKRTIDI